MWEVNKNDAACLVAPLEEQLATRYYMALSYRKNSKQKHKTNSHDVSGVLPCTPQEPSKVHPKNLP